MRLESETRILYNIFILKRLANLDSYFHNSFMFWSVHMISNNLLFSTHEENIVTWIINKKENLIQEKRYNEKYNVFHISTPKK